MLHSTKKETKTNIQTKLMKKRYLESQRDSQKKTSQTESEGVGNKNSMQLFVNELNKKGSSVLVAHFDCRTLKHTRTPTHTQKQRGGQGGLEGPDG